MLAWLGYGGRPAQLAGRDAGRPADAAGEVGGVAEADEVGDLFDAEAGLGKQAPRPFEPQAQNVLHRRYCEGPAEQPAEVFGGQACGVREIVDAKVGVAMPLVDGGERLEQPRIACRRMPNQSFVSDMLLTSVVDFGAAGTGHILHSQMLRNGMGSERCRVDGDEGSVRFGLWGGQIELSSRKLGPDPVIVDTSAITLLPSQAGALGDLLLAIEEGREPQVSARRNLATIRHILADDRSAHADARRWEELAG